MKSLMRIMTIALFMMVGSFSFGEGLEHKPTKIEFNQRIDNSSLSQSSLQNDISGYFEQDLAELEDEATEEKAEEKKVVELIDAELHVGGRDEKKIVDRRFNSVGPAKVAANPDLDASKKN